MSSDYRFWVEATRPSGWQTVRNATDATDLFSACFDVVAGWQRGGVAHYGVHGSTVGVRVPAVARPRGRPWDVSARVLAETEEFAENGFSHTWALLAELEAFADRHPDHAEQTRLNDLIRVMRVCGRADRVRVVCWQSA